MFLVAVPVARMSGWCCGTPPARKSSTLSLRPTTAELRCKFSVVPSVCPIIRKQYTKNVVYWIIRLMLSLLRWPKVILLCGGHFISKFCVFYSPGLRDSLLDLGQVLVRGRQNLETKGGGRMWPCSHGPCPEQDWSPARSTSRQVNL